VQIDDTPLFTVGGPHLITEILGLCGGENVFADADAQALPVDLESVLARSPEVILSTDTDAPAPYWARFPELTAVARGNLYQSDGDLLARPSPRIADGAADVCRRLDEARAKRK
jgi:iron complex transport system substrate-binding protein